MVVATGIPEFLFKIVIQGISFCHNSFDIFVDFKNDGCHIELHFFRRKSVSYHLHQILSEYN